MTSPHGTYPPFVGRFKLQIGASVIGSFTEVSGLAVKLDVEEVTEGGQNGYTHRLLGRMRWPNLVFKRGLTDSDALFAWLMECSGEGLAKNKSVRGLNGKVSVLTASGESMRKWELVGVLPVRWTGPKLAASARELAVEELEVCHHGFRSSK